MAKDTYIQHQLINIPATTGTNNYSFLFKADDCYEFLSGVGCYSITGSVPTADDIQIEFRSDYKSILSYSPYANWVKNPASPSFNLQDIYKPLQVDARGRNFYLNVRVTNCSAFNFMALVKQTKFPVPCIRYDAQSWKIASPALGQGVSITLPSDFKRCKGIMLTGGQAANANVIGFDIYDSGGQIVDPLPMSVLTPTINTPYDSGFYPVDFDSKSKQLFVRLNPIATLAATYVATDYTVTFLLIDENNA